MRSNPLRSAENTEIGIWAPGHLFIYLTLEVSACFLMTPFKAEFNTPEFGIRCVLSSVSSEVEFLMPWLLLT